MMLFTSMNNPAVLSSLFAYTAASFAIASAPGPDLLLVLRFATKEGIRPAMGVVLGIVTSLFLWGGATILGFSGLIFTFKPIFTLLKWAGTFYLIYLGIRLLLTKKQKAVFDAESEAETGLLQKTSFGESYRQGLVTNLLNPMIGVLFLVIFPGFIPKGADIKMFTLLLTLIQMGVAFTVFTTATLLSQPVSVWIKGGSGPVWVDRIAGAALLFFAVKLFFAQPPM